MLEKWKIPSSISRQGKENIEQKTENNEHKTVLKRTLIDLSESLWKFHFQGINCQLVPSQIRLYFSACAPTVYLLLLVIQRGSWENCFQIQIVKLANTLQSARKKFGNMSNLYEQLFCHDNLIGFNNSPEVIQVLLNDGTCMNIRCSLAPPRSCLLYTSPSPRD